MAVSTRCRILLVAAAFSGACGSESSITQPDPIPGTTSTTPPPATSSPVTLVLKGTVVDEDNQPVAGANVKYWVTGAPPAATAVTDASGAFELNTGSPVLPSPRPDLHLAQPVRVEKGGYEPSDGLVDDRCCQRVRLYRIRQITAGENVTLPLYNGAFCGDIGYDFICRRIRVTSPSKGILTVRVVPDDLIVVFADGGRGVSSSLSVPVDAHSEIAFDVWSNYFAESGVRLVTFTSAIE